MEKVQVKIRGIVSTTLYGTLESGDILRTDAAFAKHLVEDCHAAEYLTAPSVAVDAEKVVKSKAKKAAPQPVPAVAEPTDAAPAGSTESTEETQADPLQPDSPQE